MYGIENYWGFLLAGILLNLTPGADTIYILTRSISQGRRAGIYSVLGISTGVLIHTMLASAGLSIILAESVVAYNIVRYLGVGYLFYLGVRMIVEKNNLFEGRDQKTASASLIKVYWQGLLTNVLNPKVAMFFLSFLPQFINPEYVNGAMPFIILGLTFLSTGTLWCLFLASSASLVSRTLRDNDRIGRMMQKVSGVVFIGLGLKLLSDK